MKRNLISLMIAALCLTGCEGNVPDPFDPAELPENNDNDGNSEGSDPDAPGGTGNDADADVSGSDDTLDESEFDKAITIVWNGDNATVTNSSKLSVSQDGAHVVIGSAGAEGKKVRINLSGSTENGSVKIYNGVKADDSNKKMLICMEGVSLKSAKGPAINIQSGKTVFVLLKDGSDNHLSDAADYKDIPENEDAKGCFFSEKQLVFSGSGTLTVESKFKHAICADDYIHIMGGNIIVKSSVSDGIHANDYVQIDGGSVDIASAGESIQCEQAELGYFYMTGGEVTLSPSGEKSGGIETASDIIIEGGNLTITAGGAAAKCLKSDNNVTIKGGTLNLTTTGSGIYDQDNKDTSASACIRAENLVTLKGGTISCTSTGAGGKGINCYVFTAEDGVDLTVRTSGGVYTSNKAQSRPKAIKATKLVTIDGGNLDITTTGTEGEGLESKDAVVINGGKIVINAKDDGINAAGVITFNGGYTYVYSSGNDGIDTNNGKANSIVVNGGVVISHAAGGAEEGFDADNHAYLTFNSGFVFCTGGQQGGGGGGGRGPGGGWPGGGGGTSSSPSCKQPTMLWSTSASKGYFTLTDKDGKVVMSCYVPRALNQNYSFISAPVTSGSSYKCGFSTTAPSGATEVFGTLFYADGTASSLSKSFTATTGYSNL